MVTHFKISGEVEPKELKQKFTDFIERNILIIYQKEQNDETGVWEVPNRKASLIVNGEIYTIEYDPLPDDIINVLSYKKR